MDGVKQDTDFGSNGGDLLALVEHGLSAGKAFGGEFFAFNRGRWAEESGGSFGAEFFAGSFDADFGYAKGCAHLALGGTAVGDELTGEVAKGGYVVLRADKDGLEAVKVVDVSVS